MDGDIAPLDEVTALAEEYGAMVYVDDCLVKVYSGMAVRVLLTISNSKEKSISRPVRFPKRWAFKEDSGGHRNDENPRPQPLKVVVAFRLSTPGVAAAQKAAIEVLMSEPEHHAKLWENTNYFRKELQSMGFDTGDSVTPIIPVMCGESSTAKAMTQALGEMGVMAGAIVFPMVARDKARIRTQMSAGLTRDDLDAVLACFEKVGPQVGVI